MARMALEERGKRLIEEGETISQRIAVDDGDADDTTLYNNYVAYVAGRPPLKVLQGQHFLAVAQAGDCNSVPFDPAACRAYREARKLPDPSRELVNEVGQPDVTPVPMPWALGTERSCPTEGLAEEERQALAHLVAGNAASAEELRAGIYADEGLLATPWTVEFECWPFTTELGVIKEDVCTLEQELLLKRRAERGPLSAEQLQKRRGAVNLQIFEDAPPMLEKEEALAAMRARWAQDRSEAERQHDAKAEAGAHFVAWLEPVEGGGRRWPAQPTAWVNWGKWFSMWRAKPRAPAMLAAQDSDEVSIAGSVASSWLTVSDISWVEVTSQAEESGWEVVLDNRKPDLDKALAALDTLEKNDIVEVKSMSKPPRGVVLVMRAICCLLGEKADWESAKTVLGDVQFLSRLKGLRYYIPPVRLERAASYVAMDEFTVEHIKKSSLACAGMCAYVRNLFEFHAVQSSAGEALEAAERQPGAQAVGKALEAAGQAVFEADDASVAALAALVGGPTSHGGQMVKPVLSCVQHLIHCGGRTDAASLTQLLHEWPLQKALIHSWKQGVDDGIAARCSLTARQHAEMAKRLKKFKGLDFSAETIGPVSALAGLLATWVAAALAYYDLVAPRKIAAFDEAEAATKALEIAKAAGEHFKHPRFHKDLQELKCLGRPPAGVDVVVFAAVVLAGAVESDAEVDWHTCQKFMGDPCSAVDRLQNLKISDVQQPNLDRVKELANQEFFSAEIMCRKSSAAASLVVWVKTFIKDAEEAEA